MNIYIDPSINNTGYAIADHEKIVDSGVIRTKAEGDIERLLELSRGLQEVLGNKELGIIRLAVVEVPGSFSYGRSTGKWSGKGVNQSALHKLNMAIGAIALTLKMWGVEVETVEAHKWKAGRKKKLDTAIAQHYAGRKVGPDEGDAIMLAVWHNHGEIAGDMVADTSRK